MSGSVPKYVLISSADPGPNRGRWRFVLRQADGAPRLVAEGVEPGVCGDRLHLLTVVRGLEALDEPSDVTLVTPSSYVREGIRHGLSEWRTNGWRWECFGRMVQVKNLDLWQRVDRAMQFHRIDCRTYRFDPPHYEGSASSPTCSAAQQPSRPTRHRWWLIRQGVQYLERIASWLRRRTAALIR